MARVLDDSFLKVERALESLEGLVAEINSTNREYPLQIVNGYDEEAGEAFVKIDSIPSWPPRWGVIVGEIGHNLRSALDYLVFQLAEDPEETRTAFPIALDENDYLKPRGRRGISYRDTCLVGVDPKWAERIDQHQPFKHPVGHPLAALNALTNRDKHRVRVPVYSLIQLPFARINVEGEDYVRELEIRMQEEVMSLEVV